MDWPTRLSTYPIPRLLGNGTRVRGDCLLCMTIYGTKLPVELMHEQQSTMVTLNNQIAIRGLERSI